MKDYKRLITFISIMMFGLMSLCQVVIAETKVTAEELKTLLSGNTTEGIYPRWETTNKMYFDATGELRRIDSLDNKERGEWYINEAGDLCIKIRKKRCNEVMRRDDGGYNVYRQDTLRFTFDKVIPGNPHKL